MPCPVPGTPTHPLRHHPELGIYTRRERHGHTNLFAPSRGSPQPQAPTLTPMISLAAFQMQFTGVPLVGWGLPVAPRQPPTPLLGSCLCLPATSNEVPMGAAHHRGPGRLGCWGNPPKPRALLPEYQVGKSAGWGRVAWCGGSPCDWIQGLELGFSLGGRCSQRVGSPQVPYPPTPVVRDSASSHLFGADQTSELHPPALLREQDPPSFLS